MKEEGKNTARESFINHSGSLERLVHIIEDKENHETSIIALTKSILVDYFMEFSDLDG